MSDGCCGTTTSLELEQAVSTTGTLSVVVIGAGPVGLAAAAHLAERGQDFVVLEAGELRLDLDPILGSTRQLAPLIDPTQHSRGTATGISGGLLAAPLPLVTVGASEDGGGSCCG